MNNAKLTVIGVIWGAMAAVLIFASSSATVVWLTIILALAATVSTLAIALGDHEANTASVKTEKSKRSNQITRLMDLLDEDEMDDLEAWMDARRDRRATNNELVDN
jgi:hypothetical protein